MVLTMDPLSGEVYILDTTFRGKKTLERGSVGDVGRRLASGAVVVEGKRKVVVQKAEEDEGKRVLKKEDEEGGLGLQVKVKEKISRTKPRGQCTYTAQRGVLKAVSGNANVRRGTRVRKPSWKKAGDE